MKYSERKTSQHILIKFLSYFSRYNLEFVGSKVVGEGYLEESQNTFVIVFGFMTQSGKKVFGWKTDIYSCVEEEPLFYTWQDSKQHEDCFQ